MPETEHDKQIWSYDVLILSHLNNSTAYCMLLPTLVFLARELRKAEKASEIALHSMPGGFQC